MRKQLAAAATAATGPNTPPLIAATVMAAPMIAGMAYSPLCSTAGIRRTSTSRSVPPPTPVIAPRMIA